MNDVARNDVDEVGGKVEFDEFINKAFSPDAVEGLFFIDKYDAGEYVL